MFWTRNEISSTVYTTDVLTRMFKEEGGNLFDSRMTSLGHTLQGGVPSPLDRARAVRLSLKCLAFIEKQHQTAMKQPSKTKSSPPESASVITIQSSSLKFVPVQEMVQHADMENRRGKTVWWEGIKSLTEALAGGPQLGKLKAADLANVQ